MSNIEDPLGEEKLEVLSEEQVAKIAGEVMGDMVYDHPEHFLVEQSIAKRIGAVLVHSITTAERYIPGPVKDTVGTIATRTISGAIGIGLRLISKK